MFAVYPQKEGTPYLCGFPTSFGYSLYTPNSIRCNARIPKVNRFNGRGGRFKQAKYHIVRSRLQVREWSGPELRSELLQTNRRMAARHYSFGFALPLTNIGRPQ